ncbi:MAG: hypothetical protein JWL62_1503 [Hyphomicrobiales bacterium]|nr:hypothetical protein [Hyphomicrobiales bacterium]
MVSINPFWRPKQKHEEVQWLSSTAIRQRRSRVPRSIALFAPLVVIALLTVLIVGIAPRSTATPPLLSSIKPTEAPAAKVAEAEQTRAREANAVRTILPSPVTPGPRPAPTPEPQPLSSAPEPMTQSMAVPPDEPTLEDTTSTPPAEQKAVNLSGAFPTPAPAPATGEPADGSEFAVYFDEAAPGEQEARSLLGDVQKKYAGQLAGGRLTYRRVRVGDSYMYRVRMSGLTQSRATELCEALKAGGGGCEVGPR